MNSKPVLAVMVVLLMVFSAAPLSDLSADKPDAVQYGFVFTSEPTHEEYDKYICKAIEEAQNVVYAMGMNISYFDYDMKLSNIKYNASACYNNYYFDTDETGVEQFFTEMQIYSMDVKVTVTLKDDCAGGDLFMSSIIGDTDKVSDIIGDKFSKGDKIVIDAKVNMAYYQEYDETDMLRNDGKYLMDSWDQYVGYDMTTTGDAVFTVGGKNTAVSFKSIDSSEYTSICNWRFSKDISDLKVGDSFEFDRNNRVIFNMHSCDYMIGNGIYNLVNTDTTSTSYMELTTVLKEKHFHTADELNSSDRIYQRVFDHNREDIAKLGAINENFEDSVIATTNGYLNYIECFDIGIYGQKDIDKLNDDINGKQTLIYALAIVCILLIVVMIVYFMKSKKTV